ncbi:MAG TPA: DJ-1/PfpI family protein, partial [Sporomusaceae bacterium]|nr:DJ-1/PfpI family protein [Sporomusaceae bacterium]
MNMITIGVLLFPDVEELDFAGPFEVLSYVNKVIPTSVEVKIIAETLEPVRCFNGLRVLPDKTVEECPQLDILVIPGGQGRKSAAQNTVLLDFIKRQHEGSQY